MSSKKAGLQKDAPWRAPPSSTTKPLPKIHHSPVLTLPQNPYSNYALSLIKGTSFSLMWLPYKLPHYQNQCQHPDPIGEGFGTEAIVEAAGPECIVPGQVTPVKLLGLKVWPIDIDLKFLEPVGKELKNIGKFMDSAVELMNKSFDER